MKAAIGYVLSMLSPLVIGMNYDVDHLPQEIDEVRGVRMIVNDIMDMELSISGVSRSSSQCWYTSVTALTRLINDDATPPVTSGSAYCAALTESQLDILALELTRCEFIKSRRGMFIADQSSDDSNSVSSDAKSACPLGTFNPSPCLEQLTDHAHDIYHQIRLHTEKLCRDLADETFQRQREESIETILRASTTFAHQIHSVLEGASSAIEQLNHQSVLLQSQSHLIEEHQRELEQIHDARHGEMVSQSLLIKQNQIELEQIFEAQKMELLDADHLRKLREEDTMSLLEHQISLITKQQTEFVETYNVREEMMKQKVNERMTELDQLQELITLANYQIKPLSTIEAYVKFATDGFSALNSIFNLFVSMSFVWFCSLPSFVNTFRRRLLGVIIIGFLMELTVIFYPKCNLYVAFGETDAVGIIRYWTRVCVIATLSISCLMSCILPSSAETAINAPTTDDFLKRQLELVTALNATLIESTAGTERKARRHENHEELRARSVRKFHSASKSRKSSSPPRRSSPKACERIATPHNGSRASYVKVKPTDARTEPARPMITVASLKETQRDYTETESSDEFTSSQSVMFASPKFTKSRKRKFSDTWACSEDEIMVRDAQNDCESESSISTGSSSSGTNSGNLKRQRI